MKPNSKKQQTIISNRRKEKYTSNFSNQNIIKIISEIKTLQYESLNSNGTVSILWWTPIESWAEF